MLLFFFVVILLLVAAGIGALTVFEVMRGRTRAAQAKAWDEGYRAALQYSASAAKYAEQTKGEKQTSAPEAPQAPAPPPNAPPRYYPKTGLPPAPSWHSGPRSQLTNPPAAQPAPRDPVAPMPQRPAPPPPPVARPQPKPPVRPVRPKTKEEIAAEKQQQTYRNINITLYTASLLIITAAALFLGAAFSPAVRFGGLLVVMTLFLVAGFITDMVNRKLRPASLAFIGTGLAMIPLAGWAIAELTGLPIPAVWAVTSVIGIIATLLTAMRFDSTVGLYLALAFFASAVLSSGLTLQRGIIWSLILMVVVSILSMIVLYMVRGRYRAPDSEEKFFQTADKSLPLGVRALVVLEQVTHLMVPAVVVAAALMFLTLTSGDYFLLFVLAGLHFGLAVVLGRPRLERVHLILAYVMFAMAILTGGHHYGLTVKTSVSVLGVYLFALAAGHYIFAARPAKGAAQKDQTGHEVSLVFLTLSGFGYLLALFVQSPLFGIVDEKSINIVWLTALVVWAGVVIHQWLKPSTTAIRIGLVVAGPVLILPSLLFWSWGSMATTVFFLLGAAVAIVQSVIPIQAGDTASTAPRYYSKHVAAGMGLFLTVESSLYFSQQDTGLAWWLVTIYALAWMAATGLWPVTNLKKQLPVRVIWPILFMLTIIASITFSFIDTDRSEGWIYSQLVVVLGLASIIGWIRAYLHRELVDLLTPIILSIVGFGFMSPSLAWFAGGWYWASALAMMGVIFGAFYLHPAFSKDWSWPVALAFMGFFTLAIGTGVGMFELGADDTWNRVGRSAVLTIGAVLTALHARGRGHHVASTVSLWLVVVMVGWMTRYEYDANFYRLTFALLLLLVLINAITLGVRGFGHVLYAPVFIGMVFGFSTLPDIPAKEAFDLLPETRAPFLLSPLGFSVILLAGLWASIAWTLSVIKKTGAELSRSLQVGSSIVLLVLVGWQTALLLPKFATSQLMAGLFLLSAAGAAYLLTRSLRMGWVAIGTVVFTIASVFHLNTSLLNFEWAAEVPVSLRWTLTAVVVFALWFIVTRTDRGIQSPDIKTYIPGFSVPKLIETSGWLTVFLASNVALFETTGFGYTATAAGLLIVTAWVLALEAVAIINRGTGATSVNRTWTAQTLAVVVTIYALYAVWRETSSNLENVLVVQWAQIGIGLALILWSLRWIKVRDEKHRKSALIWSTGVFLAALIPILNVVSTTLGVPTEPFINLAIIGLAVLWGIRAHLLLASSGQPSFALGIIMTALVAAGQIKQLIDPVPTGSIDVPEDIIWSLIAALALAAWSFFDARRPLFADLPITSLTRLQPALLTAAVATLFVTSLLRSIDMGTLAARTNATILAVITAWLLVWMLRVSSGSVWWARAYTYLLQTGAVAVSFITITSVVAPRSDAYADIKTYWVLLAIAAVTAAWALRFVRAQREWFITLMIGSAAALSIDALWLILLDSTPAMDFWALAGFAVLIAIGLTTSTKLMTYWGASGIFLSVLWQLRHLTFLWVGLLGLALIGLAVWQLRKSTKDNTPPPPNKPENSEHPKV